MNANELADWLENWFPTSDEEWYDGEQYEMKKAAIMLRQQQTKIVKLKLEWQYMYEKANMESIDEPVAWVIGTCPDDYRNVTQVLEQAEEELEHYKKFGDNDDKIIPLYTHPAKTLTDEEIIKTMVQFDVYSADDQCLIEAGRAILKKASEK